MRAADVFAIVPATANTLAKLARGFADDLLTNAALAARVPIVVAPAMNAAMYEHPATRENLRLLIARGVSDRRTGRRLSGRARVGVGRLAEQDEILAAIDGAFAERTNSRDNACSSRRVPRAKRSIRCASSPTPRPERWASNSRAKPGARRARDARVGPTLLEPPAGAEVLRVSSAQEMYDATLGAFAGADVAIASAAMADWRPAVTFAHKVKKFDSVTRSNSSARRTSWPRSEAGKPTRSWSGSPRKPTTTNARAQKLSGKHLDAIALNDVPAAPVSARARTRSCCSGARRTQTLGNGVEGQLARALWDALGGLRSECRAARDRRRQHRDETRRISHGPAGGRIAQMWRLGTARRRTADEIGDLVSALFASSLAPEEIESIASRASCPKTIASWPRRAWPTSVASRVLSAATQTSIEVATDRPREVGSDLVCGRSPRGSGNGAPAIVIGFGTATTFSAISREGAYLGAAIAPGIQISIDALVERTAKLPQVALEAPAHVIGRRDVGRYSRESSTASSGQTEGLVARMKRELGDGTR